jgi:lipopolysaccharide/colanic/teichoic acid biosynthesis glycosyltransferase
VRRTARLLSFLGAAGAVLALSKVHAAYVADPPYDFTGSSRFAWALGYVLLLWVAGYGFGLPDLPRSVREAIVVAASVSAAAAVGVSVLQLLVGDALLPRFVVFGSATALVPWQVAVNALARSGRTRDEGRDQVIFVGAMGEADRLRADLQLAPERPAVLAAHLLPSEAGPDRPRSASVDRPLVDLVLRERATVIVLDRTAQSVDDVVSQAAALHEAGVRVRTLVQFYEEWLGKLPVGELERASLFFDIGEVHRVRYGRIKRLVDLVLAALGTVVLVAAVPFVWLGDLVANRGPLLYRQERVGRDGTTFAILKFRTMAPTDPQAASTDWTATDDPRITPFGRVLRTTHLDELPQVVNILRGELSVVGPRPEQPRYVVELSESLPFYGMRHLVRPGLTGWAQVKYGYAGDQRDALEKLQYEFFYLRHQSLRFDLRVIGRTVRSVAGTEGKGR